MRLLDYLHSYECNISCKIASTQCAPHTTKFQCNLLMIELMDELPEVVRVALLKACSLGQILSWKVKESLRYSDSVGLERSIPRMKLTRNLLMLCLTLGAHAPESYSSQSVCLSFTTLYATYKSYATK